MGASVRADSPLYSPRARRQGRSSRSLARDALARGRTRTLLVGVLLGLAFAGSRQQLGRRDAGGRHRHRRVDCAAGGTEARAAVRRRQRAAGDLLGGRQDELVRGAISSASSPTGAERSRRRRRAGDGFGPIRGYRRLHTRFFGAEILPRVGVSDAALDFALDAHGQGRRPAADERGARPARAPDRERAGRGGPATRSRGGRADRRPCARLARAGRRARSRSRSSPPRRR